MSIQGTDGLDQPRAPRRRVLAPSPVAVRAAGLYSEVVWDRSWATPPARERSATNEADRQHAPSE